VASPGRTSASYRLMIIFAWRAESKLVMAIGIIWLGHIGWDRFFGYGLKYDSDFKHTHLGDLNKGNRSC